MCETTASADVWRRCGGSDRHRLHKPSLASAEFAQKDPGKGIFTSVGSCLPVFNLLAQSDLLNSAHTRHRRCNHPKRSLGDSR